MGNGIAQIAAMAGDDAVAARRRRGRAASAPGRRSRRASAGSSRRERLTADEADAVLGRHRVHDRMAAGADRCRRRDRGGARRCSSSSARSGQAIGELAPADALLGTNTSQLSITRSPPALGDDAARLVGIHFFNPPVMMRLVEIIAGLQTRADEVERARAFADATRQGGRRLPQGQPRLHHQPRLRDPAARVHADARGGRRDAREDIDTALRLGFNFPMGPLELGDLNGLDTYPARASTGLSRGLRRAVPADRRPARTWSRPIGWAGRPARASIEYDDEGRKV